jgi:hypothetical protein
MSDSPSATPGVTVCDEGPWGFSWIAAEPPWMQRASHALVVPGADGPEVWIIDPVDFPGLDDRVRALGRPTGVIQLLDRHNRDCAAVSARLGVPIWITPREVPGSPFEVLEVKRGRGWQEVALWWAAQRVLVVAEAVGTPRYYRAPGERLGIHPMLRLTPPRMLQRYRPEHILVGHGAGIHEDAPGALAAALDRSRVNALRVLPRLLTFSRG